ncbi:caspase family protein [Bremerella sp. JC817]|uniref:caspase family protein n=1 Tax=Bremerella sp. JC817 TaxID=3231756 RepID=UPI003457F207
MLRLLQANLIALLVVIATNPLAVAQEILPAESILPGQADRPKFPPEMLPAESVVPGLPVKSNSPQPMPKEDPSPSDANALPGEDQLPNVKTVQQVILPEDPPWLRLNLDGPTAPVQSVAFSQDGQHLLAGGNDKMLHSWLAAPAMAGQAPRWIYENPIRWQVQRATRGDIHALAALDGKLAFAGIGASALTGEIVLADQGRMAFERTLFDVQKGPRSQILDLAATSTGLFSLDSEGNVQYWSADPMTGKWSFRPGTSPKPAVPFDAAQLRSWRLRGSRVASTDDRTLFFPVLVRDDRGIPFWRIARWKSDGQNAALLPQLTHEFPGGIGAMACSRDGQRIVAADISDSGTLLLVDLSEPQSTLAIPAAANVRDVAMSADGTKVAAVVARSSQGPFELRIWSWPVGQKPAPVATLPLSTIATGCAMRRDGRLLAVTQESSLVVYDLNDLNSPLRLTTPIVTPTKVAFTLAADYQLLIDQSSTGNAPANSAILFDTARRGYSTVDQRPAVVPSNPWQGKWSLAQRAVDRGTRLVYDLTQDGKPYATIPETILNGSRVVSVCWLAMGEDRDAPTHIAVGTVGRNHAYLLDIRNPEKITVVREYRGHASAIRAIGVSADQKYLTTGSDDGLVNIWKLTEEQPSTALQNQWGANFQQIGEQLVVAEIIPDGPLYYHGVRNGDVVQSVAIREDANPDAPLDDQAASEKLIADVAALQKVLRETRGDTMLRFQIVRNGAQQKPFYLHPAWQPLASLVATNDREWAYWTPYGYYDASFNGHKMFGWQINRGIDQAPDFFLAAELKQQLEKPRVMEKLLKAGSLSEAMRVAKAEVPFNLHNRLEALASLRPQITIDSPTAESDLAGGEVIVEATIEVPAGSQLLTPKVFANGVPAVGTLDHEVGPGPAQAKQHKLRWRVALPPDPRVRLEVIAATADGITANQSLTVAQSTPDRVIPPRIFVIAAGVSQYADQQIPQLDFAAQNAKAFTSAIQQHAQQSNVEAIVLTDSNVTQPLWNVAADTIWQQLAESARPQDVVLFFLSGHGIRDVESQRYFFLTSDSQFNDVAGRRYERCLSSEDFQRYFAGIPCRKVAILDTCHSGAIQPLRQDDLKVMLRALEEDVVFTITASEGNEEAFESRDRQLGRFTARLVEAISGGADQSQYAGNGDGQISLSEVAAYVQATVPQDAAAAGQSQHPTIFPRDLFPLIDVTLSRSETK